MIKSRFAYEYTTTNNTIILINLLTFQYIQLDLNETQMWREDAVFDRLLANKLFQLGFLVESDELMDRKINHLISSMPRKRGPNHVIMMTDLCNQRCPYCFEDFVQNGMKSIGVISEHQIDRIISMISKINQSFQEFGNIILFGGEPLLIQNMEVFKYLVRKVRDEKLPPICIVTNGTTLDSYLGLIFESREQIKYIVLTLNGKGELHDLLRDSLSSPTFTTIVSNIKALLAMESSIEVKINLLIEKRNVDRMNDLLNYFEREGFFQDKRVSIKFARIQSRFKPLNPYRYELPYDDYYPRLIKNYPNYEKLISGGEVSFLESVFFSWKQGLLYLPTLNGCEATYPGRLCYHVDGLIYPCTEVIGNEKYVIGDYMNGILHKDYETWKDYRPNTSKKCQKCRFILVCHGGCLVSNKEVNGRIDSPYCLDMGSVIDKFVATMLEKR